MQDDSARRSANQQKPDGTSPKPLPMNSATFDTFVQNFKEQAGESIKGLNSNPAFKKFSAFAPGSLVARAAGVPTELRPIVGAAISGGLGPLLALGLVAAGKALAKTFEREAASARATLDEVRQSLKDAQKHNDTPKQ